MMMDDSAPIHERRKLVKNTKNVIPRKRIMVAEVCGETYSKNDKRWSRKTVKNVVRINPTNLRETLRESEKQISFISIAKCCSKMILDLE